MRPAESLKPADRQTVDTFIAAYCDWVDRTARSILRPEEDPSTPPDRRIEAIVQFDAGEMHLEHTSVDLIASGRTNKRALDPGFRILEEELNRIISPGDLGLWVTLRLEYAKDIARLRRVSPLLRQELEAYLARTPSEEWAGYPRPPDIIEIQGMEFPVRPDFFRRGKVRLQWSATDSNFLDGAALDGRLAGLLPSKLRKLDASHANSTTRGFSVLVVETNDIAAPGFHSWCGVFARFMAAQTTSCSEIWGIQAAETPTLVWFDALDRGRSDCPYLNDAAGRTVAEIEYERRARWFAERKEWLSRR